MEWAPMARVLVVKVALPDERTPVPRLVIPSRKVTVPVGVVLPVAGATVPVKVMLVPATAVVAVLERVVVVATEAGALTVMVLIGETLPASLASPA